VRDVLPEEVPLWRRLEETARRLAELRGFREIRPALLEEARLFTRAVGEVTDIVEKEMFTLQKGETRLALRPEGTAGIVRAYLEAGWDRTAPVQKLFTIGPMFRYERPQKGRERMFTQFDVEAIGSLDPRLDAEVVHLAALFFEELGIRGLEVRISSMGDGEDRVQWRDAVRAFVAPTLGERCELCRARFERNVLRVLDCKNPRDVELNRDAPRMLDHLSDENRAHFERVRALLEALGRRVVVDPSIVRGLDYYTRTVFEVHEPSLGARSALCGGGRYDHLVRDLGGADLGAVGFAIGFSGTLIALRELGLADAVEAEAPAAFVVAAGEELADAALLLAEELRAAGIAAAYEPEGRSVKAQMRAAARGGHRVALVLGPDELERGTVQVKDLESGAQREVARAELVSEVRSALERGAASRS
jgi:histidyl-tRNA synthetase